MRKSGGVPDWAWGVTWGVMLLGVILKAANEIAANPNANTAITVVIQ